jgi:hypothetical protein
VILAGRIRRIGDHVSLSDWSPVECGELPVVGGAALAIWSRIWAADRLVRGRIRRHSDEIDEAPADVAAVDSYSCDRIAFERRRQLVDARLSQVRCCRHDERWLVAIQLEQLAARHYRHDSFVGFGVRVCVEE